MLNEKQKKVAEYLKGSWAEERFLINKFNLPMIEVEAVIAEMKQDPSLNVSYDRGFVRVTC